MKFNPFRPGKAAPPKYFAGRKEKLGAINKILNQTKHGNSQHFAIIGERGIGKSSLLDVAGAAATGDTVEGVEKYDFVVLAVTVTSKDDDLTIIKKITSRLQTELDKKQKAKDLLKRTWALAQRIEVAGTGLKESASAEPSLVDPVAYLAQIMAEAIASLGEKTDGILLLIDEADTSGAAVGRIVKQLVDALSDEKCDRVSIGVAGMPNLLKRLAEGHESAPRIFDPLPLETMSTEESMEIVTKGLAEVAAKGTEVLIEDSALRSIARNSDGYPQFVQQMASSAFDIDSDNNITFDDVVDGLLNKGGAIEVLGVKHFHVPFIETTKSDQYRAVLLAMAKEDYGYVTKETIRSKTKLKETTLTNAIHALKEREMIVANPEKNGEYRLQSRAFSIYVRLASKGRQHLKS